MCSALVWIQGQSRGTSCSQQAAGRVSQFLCCTTSEQRPSIVPRSSHGEAGCGDRVFARTVKLCSCCGFCAVGGVPGAVSLAENLRVPLPASTKGQFLHKKKNISKISETYQNLDTNCVSPQTCHTPLVHFLCQFHSMLCQFIADLKLQKKIGRKS